MRNLIYHFTRAASCRTMSDVSARYILSFIASLSWLSLPIGPGWLSIRRNGPGLTLVTWGNALHTFGSCSAFSVARIVDIHTSPRLEWAHRSNFYKFLTLVCPGIGALLKESLV